MINGLISCIANTRTSVPPPSFFKCLLASLLPSRKEHWKLLSSLKTTVEGLLSTNNPNVWSRYGGLQRLHKDMNNILSHGLRNEQVSTRSPYRSQQQTFFCFCFNRTRMAFTKITPAYSHAWGKIKNAAFARYVLCVLYLISRAVSVPSDSGMKTKTLCCTFSATLCCTEGAFALINCINTACLMRFWCMHLLRLGMFM